MKDSKGEYSTESLFECIKNNIKINDEFPEFPDGLDFPEMDLSNLTATEIGLSEEMLNEICVHETGHKFGYKMKNPDLVGYDLKDAGGHLTYGYGLLYHPNGKFMDSIKKVWSQEELEGIYLQTVKNTVKKIKDWESEKNIQLKQQQIDAIASACFNFGPGFLKKNVCKLIAENPDNPEIKNVWAHLSDAQGKKFPGLIKRRVAEASWYFG